MKIQIRGAREHNLKDVDVDINDGLTVVTGVSGSGKTSLIFDTLYKEARRRFLEAFSVSKEELHLNSAKVRSITGLGPTIALGQNLLNRNQIHKSMNEGRGKEITKIYPTKWEKDNRKNPAKDQTAEGE